MEEQDLTHINITSEQIIKKIKKDWSSFILLFKTLISNQEIDVLQSLLHLMDENMIDELRLQLDKFERLVLAEHLNAGTPTITKASLDEIFITLKKSFISTSVKIPADIFSALNSVPKGKIKEFILDNPNYFGMLSPLFSKERFADILNSFSTQELDQHLSRSMDKHDESNRDMFFTDLKTFFLGEKNSPLKKSLSTIITKLNYEKEKVLLENLKNKNDFEVVLDATKDHFPSFLLTKIPPKTLEGVTKDITAQVIINFINSCTQEEKEHWSALILEQSTQKNEMIRLETQVDQTDMNSFLKLQQKETFYQEVREKIRLIMNSNERSEIVKEWLNS